jgi:hypothetical protein
MSQPVPGIDVCRPETRNPRVKPFKDRGGKIIIYQGWMDPSVIASQSIEILWISLSLYQAVVALGETDVMCTGLSFPSVKDTAPFPVVRVGSHAMMGLPQNTDATFSANMKRIATAAPANLPNLI